MTTEQEERRKKMILTLQNQPIDYAEIKSKSKINIWAVQNPDIAIIIPVRGRTQFVEPLLKSLNKAISVSPFTVSINFVEHSEVSEFENILPFYVNYAHITSAHGVSFNKCLCMNFGAIFLTKKPKYYLFHDLDLLVTKKFFINLYEKLKENPCSVIQTFKNKRVWYLSPKLSQDIIDGKIKSINQKDNIDDMVEGIPGAPGGSILVERKRFFEIGMYVAEVFSGYSQEDLFFYEMLSQIEPVGSANSEIYHLSHEVGDRSNAWNTHDFMRAFKEASKEDKFLVMEIQKQKYLKYMNV